MQSIELIRQFIHERVGSDPEKVVGDALLVDLGVDSLLLAEMLFDAEDRLGLSIDSDIALPKTVNEMVTLLDNELAIKASKG